MARKQAKQTKERNLLHDAANVVKRLFTRGRRAEQETEPVRSASERQSSQSTMSNAASPARVTRRGSDIPLDVLDRSYTPAATSSKASFRSDGSDHQKDQEFAFGVADDRWNDEDRITNKSGDPRIGTHRRTYEPAEARTDSHE
jgi:hypothetical protein